MDLAQALNAPEPVTLAGRTFLLRQLTLAEWAQLQAWLKAAAPSPVTQALRAVQEAADLGVPLSPDVRDQLFEHAQALARAWPPAVGSAAWLRAFNGVPGGPDRFLGHVLRCCGHDVGDGEAGRLFAAATQHEADELLRVAFHGDPPAPPDPAPKADPGTGPAPTRPTTGARPSTGSPPSGGGRRKRSGP